MQVSSNAPPDEPSFKVFWVGIGCKRDTSKAVIKQAVRSIFQAYGLAEGAIAGMATIDTKVGEVGLIEFCRDQNLPLFFYTAEVLRSVAVPNPAGAIDIAVGTPSVAEAAAIWACWEAEGGDRRREHWAASEAQRRGDVVQTVLSSHPLHPIPQLCVPKQRYRSAGQSGTVTIAVVRSGRSSHICW